VPLGQTVFGGPEGDVRRRDDPMLITSHHAPSAELLRQRSEGLPAKLAAAGVAPRVPWIDDLKLDFRFGASALERSNNLPPRKAGGRNKLLAPLGSLTSGGFPEFQERRGEASADVGA
jgi:hypothetical protein